MNSIKDGFKIMCNKKQIVAGLTAFLLLAIGLFASITPVSGQALTASTLCGEGSSPDYGFSYDLRQPHWTVGWEGYISEQTVNEVDSFLDKLNNENVAQTMILILPPEKVGNRVNCAVHFLRYMQLGQPDGPRKDNGFVFLVVVEHGKIDIHYGVGLGLPALTASELTDLNRLAEDSYRSTGSTDEALLSLVKGFYQVSRANYPPLVIPTATPQPITLPEGNAGIAVMCCLLCIVALVVMFIIWLFIRLARSGINIDFPDTGSSWNGGGGGSNWGGGWGGGSSGGGITRGGSGSGRSGRGN